MKINEVEGLVGITKKNIRFYEAQGLLAPKRNAENSYRDYGESEVRLLYRIKLLRKLGVPVVEIRNMLSGTYTVADGMRRHRITLEREKTNLQQSIALCQQLQDMDIPIAEMDAEKILAQMAEMERGGTIFQNKQLRDIRTRYIAPVLIAIIVVALMISLSGIMLWAYHTAPEEAPPLWSLWFIIGFFAAIGGGVLLALTQRMKEIEGGEEEDAGKY